MLKIKTRSPNGCWTCRLRRKKCDEQRPACNRCKNLQLPCDGYADRPRWMDRGELERLKAEETKNAIRSNRRSLKRGSSFDQSILNSALAESSPPASSRGSTDEARKSPDPETSTILAPPGEERLHIQNEAFATGTCSHISTSSSNFLQVIPESDSMLTSWLPPITWSESAPSSARSTKASLFQLKKCCGRPRCDLQSSAEEGELLLHYFDDIHSVQFPFSLKSNRGWLYSIIVRSKVCYWSTLALSAYSKNSSLSCYYNMAILELRKCLCLMEIEVEARLDMTLDCCFSMIQLMLLEIQRDETELCKMHMSAASSLLAGLQVSGKTFTATRVGLLFGQHCTGSDRVNLTVLRFVVVMLQWLDTICTCSIRSDPSCQEWLRELLHDEKPELADLVGCQSAVAASISRISELDSWKRRTGRGGRVSIVEMVRRATDIEKILQTSLCASDAGAGINQGHHQSLIQALATTDPASALLPQEVVIWHITGIFACAATVYLHIVIAGAQADVPEIRGGVQETIKRLRNMPSPYLLRYLAWPFCATGCLAATEDRPFFINLADVAAAVEDGSGTTANLEKCVAVMRECWRLRDDGNCPDAGWTEAMDMLGVQNILL